MNRPSLLDLINLINYKAEHPDNIIISDEQIEEWCTSLSVDEFVIVWSQCTEQGNRSFLGQHPYDIVNHVMDKINPEWRSIR